MARGMKAVAGAAGLVGGAIVARRGRDKGRDKGGARTPRGEGRQAVTVLAPVDEVQVRWRDHAASTGLATVEVEVRTAPGDRGTELLARVPDEAAEAAEGTEATHGTDGTDVSDERLRAELRRFKSLVECGTVMSTEGQPSGRGSRQEALTRTVTDRLRAWGAA